MLKVFRQKRRRNYYNRIFTLFLLFIFLTVIPFASIIYRNSQKSILNSIDQSNSIVLQQMKYNYIYFKKSMSSLCLTVFFRSDIQAVLYQKDVAYNDIYNSLKALREDVIAVQPSVKSIEIYNGKMNKWYSTETGSVFYSEEFINFIKSQKQIPKLAPILRPVNEKGTSINTSDYVFSYFMFEYSNPVTGEDSYIVINQNTNWFIDSIANTTGGNVKNNVYLASSNGEIYDYQGIDHFNETEQYLIRNCTIKKKESNNNAKMGFYTDSYQGKKYLVSYLDLENRGNTLIMIQDYDEVFFDINKSKNNFILVSVLFALFSITMVFVLTKRIYRPVNKLLTYVSDLDGSEESSLGVDEFEHLKSVYLRVREANIKLSKQKESSTDIMQRYLLNNLLRESNPKEYEHYCRQLPHSMLSKAKSFRLHLILLYIDSIINNRFRFLEKDEGILLYALKNVFCEISAGKYEVETTQDNPMELVLVLNCENPDTDDTDIIFDLIKQLQAFAKKHLDITISASYGGTATSIDDLPQLYEKAQLYLKYRIIHGPGTLLEKDICSMNINNTNITYSWELRKQLEEKLKLGNIEKINEVLECIKNEICKLKYDNIIISIMDLITTINFCINEANFSQNEPIPINFNEMYKEVITEEFVDNLFGKLAEYVNSVLSFTYESDKKQKNKDQVFVDTVVKYVAANYPDINLSSQIIADYMGISGRYVVKKFKQCTGISLNDYIVSIRMKQAVSLLTSTNMSVNKIAENIGFENDNYFYHLFKKIYGCTPREFSNKSKQQLIEISD